VIRRLIVLWADLKQWWETRHARAAYRRLFKVRTHPTSPHGRKGVTDRDINS
jgi:hypothetical protein